MGTPASLLDMIARPGYYSAQTSLAQTEARNAPAAAEQRLAAGRQGLEAGGLDIQMKRQQIKDSAAIAAAIQASSSLDPGLSPQAHIAALQGLVLKNGGSGQSALALTSTLAKQAQEYQGLAEGEQKITAGNLAQAGDTWQGVLSAKPEDRASVYAAALPDLRVKAPKVPWQDTYDPAHEPIYTGALNLNGVLLGQKKMASDISAAQTKSDLEKQQAREAQFKADIEAKRLAAMNSPSPQNDAALVASIANPAMAAHPSLAPMYVNEAQSAKAQIAAIRASTLMPDEQTKEIKSIIQTSSNHLSAANEQYINGQHRIQEAQTIAAPARADRSYQFNTKELDTLAKPVNDTLAKIADLNELMRQATPTADALLAPKLLSVTVGGQGSGLRMNNAEISRIVGGRSLWQGLEAKLNQVQLDPSKANSITPEQRQQMAAIVSAINDKLTRKQAIINQAQQALVSEDQPANHKRIVANTKTKVAAIDQEAPPVTAESRREQTSNLGNKRHTLDGGKTWLPGPLPAQ